MNLIVLMPLYNDWECFNRLIEKIKQVVPASTLSQFSFLVVNDHSSSDINEVPSGINLEIIDLTRNIGHQKAIAIGLAYVAENKTDHHVIVMDSDGEDRPEDLQALITKWEGSGKAIVFAERKKRKEGLSFVLFYEVYKILFKLLTGKSISFGNFSILSNRMVQQIVNVSEIWSHFACGVLRSKLPFSTLALDRGTRLTGESKMNFTSLVLHGLSAVSVFLDTVSVRLLFATIGLMVMSVVCIIIVICIKFFTVLAIPGWTTSAVIGLSIIFMQAFLVSLFLVFIVLSYRTQKVFIPSKHYRDYIYTVRKIS